MAGLVLHLHHIGRIADFAAPLQMPPLRDQRLQHILGTMQDEPDIGILLGRMRNAGNNGCRPLVAAHGVYGYDGASGTRFRLFHPCGHADARLLNVQAASSSRSTSSTMATTSRSA